MLDKIASYFIYIRLCSIQRGYSHPYIQATFTPAANYGAQGIQLCDGGLILCWRRIRKFDENKQTDRQRTDRQTDRQRIQLQRPLSSPLIVGVSGPTSGRGQL